jgi:hypothetical protein
MIGIFKFLIQIDLGGKVRNPKPTALVRKEIPRDAKVDRVIFNSLGSKGVEVL